MSETATETVVQKPEASASNWDALNASKQFGDVELVQKQEKVEEEKKQEEIKDQVEGKTEEVKTETKTEEKKEEATTEEKKEEKVEDKKDEKPQEKELEFTPEDLGVKADAPEDSWLRLAQDLKLEGVEQDSFEAVQAAFEKQLKAAEEKGKAFKKDDVFADIQNPDVAATLKLMEATGMTAEQALLPTQTLDAYMKLEDAELVRQDLSEREGWDAERVEHEMEYLNDKGLLKHEASKIREDLVKAKTAIVTERNAKLQEYEQNKIRVANQRAEAQKSQIINSLKSMKEFMGGKLPEATREAAVKMFNQGGYDNIINSPDAFAEFIYYKSLGEKAFKAKLEAEYQRGKLEKAKDLANVPPINGKTGNQKEQKTNQINNWDALEKSKEFGTK